jgi:hypothetical protein
MKVMCSLSDYSSLIHFLLFCYISVCLCRVSREVAANHQHNNIELKCVHSVKHCFFFKNIRIYVQKLFYVDLWRKWFDSAKDDPMKRSGSMYIHAKFPDKLKASQPWAGEHTLEHSYVPEWNDVKVCVCVFSDNCVCVCMYMFSFYFGPI